MYQLPYSWNYAKLDIKEQSTNQLSKFKVISNGKPWENGSTWEVLGEDVFFFRF